MFKRLLVIAVFCGVVSTAWAADGRPVRLMTYFVIPDGTDHEGLQQLATQYDAVIVHEWSASKLPELRAANPQIICLLYKDAMAVHLRNSTEGVCQYDEISGPENEDWFLHNDQGERIFFDWDNNGTLDNAAMNPANQEWQQFFATSAITDALEQGWDGIFLDDLWTYNGVYGADQGFDTDEELQDAICSFLDYQLAACHSYGIWLTGNIGWWTVEGNDVWRDYITRMDAGMQEKFSRESVYQWYDQLQELSQSIGGRNYTILCTWGDLDDLRKALFSFCNALLVADGQRVYYGYGSYTSGTRQPPYYPWYDRQTDLGRPVSEVELDFTRRIAHRAYLHGHVYVNPETDTETITLPAGDWYDIEGNPVSSITLGAYSGSFVCDRP